MEAELKAAEGARGKQAQGEGFDYGTVLLGAFDPADIITLPTLARLFSRHSETVKRAIAKRELPEPIRLFGTLCWTQRVLVEHLERRLALAAKERERLATKVEKLRP